MQSITLTQPDDLHLHVREGDALKSVVPHTAKQFARAIIMPNLANPVTTASHAKAYQIEINNALKEANLESSFEPLMTLYLTDKTDAKTIQEAKDSGFIHALKLYPAGAPPTLTKV